MTVIDVRDVVERRTGPDPESVYQVLHVVATHPHSWEHAAADAIAELGRTIDDLRLARVIECDVALGPDSIRSYRVKLAVSYRLDRRRTLVSGAVEVVHRVLVVANRTVGGSDLMAAVAERVSRGPVEFHVLVPVMIPSVAGGTAYSDPYAGHVGSLESESDTEVDFAWAAAEQRLTAQLELLRATGATATGELRPIDPLKAALAVLQRASFDEIIVSTLPASMSRWLRLDLPSRLARHTTLPIVHIEQIDERSDPPGATPAPGPR